MVMKRVNPLLLLIRSSMIELTWGCHYWDAQKRRRRCSRLHWRYYMYGNCLGLPGVCHDHVETTTLCSEQCMGGTIFSGIHHGLTHSAWRRDATTKLSHILRMASLARFEHHLVHDIATEIRALHLQTRLLVVVLEDVRNTIPWTSSDMGEPQERASGQHSTM